MTSDTNTTDIREAHRFDTARLNAYLAHALPPAGPIRAIEQFKAGQSNPTFLITSDGGRFVLRKKPPGDLLPSAHLVEREYRVQAALAETGVPVPRMRLLCEDASVIGTTFYVMDHVEGRVPHDPALPDMAEADRRAVYRSMAATMAALHTVDWHAVGLAEFGKPGAYVARQIKRWTGQYRASETDPIPAMEELIAWLPSRIPANDETTIVHGDFRPGNLILHPREPRVIAVLDWELSTLGHPLSDLAYNCLPYHLDSGSSVLPGLSGPKGRPAGIPTEEDYLAIYCERAGRPPLADWAFFLAFAFFRMAAISQGVYHRGLMGNASAPNALDFGDRARALAKAGWERASAGLG